MPRTIFITGASSGIGKATARTFHDAGWNVVATMRTPDDGRELAALERVLVTRLDVEDHTSIASAMDAALARVGRMDVLLNNAGYGAYGVLEAMSLDTMRRQFNVNVLGLLAVTRAALPHLRASQGTIVNVSSIGGRMAFPLGTLYHGSKFAVEGLSEALHFELAPLGVRVKVVQPGMIQTDFAGRSFDFTNDPALTDYQPTVGAFFATLGPMAAQASPPEVVSEVILGAVTDGTTQLRYPAGADAVALLAQRGAVDDATFFAGMRAQFGLADGPPHTDTDTVPSPG